ASIVGITYAQIFEWNTIPLVNNALENGKTITFPKANPKTREMDFYAINQIDELKPGYAGIYEPDPEITTYKNKSEIDLLRSEEHTSELQSRFDLVCRLLPEK